MNLWADNFSKAEYIMQLDTDSVFNFPDVHLHEFVVPQEVYEWSPEGRPWNVWKVCCDGIISVVGTNLNLLFDFGRLNVSSTSFSVVQIALCRRHITLSLGVVFVNDFMSPKTLTFTCRTIAIQIVAR